MRIEAWFRRLETIGMRVRLVYYWVRRRTASSVTSSSTCSRSGPRRHQREHQRERLEPVWPLPAAVLVHHELRAELAAVGVRVFAEVVDAQPGVDARPEQVADSAREVVRRVRIGEVGDALGRLEREEPRAAARDVVGLLCCGDSTVCSSSPGSTRRPRSAYRGGSRQTYSRSCSDSSSIPPQG
jgi:hypothetical protein